MCVGGQPQRGKLILKQFPCEYNFQNLLLSEVRKVIFSWKCEMFLWVSNFYRPCVGTFAYLKKFNGSFLVSLYGNKNSTLFLSNCCLSCCIGWRRLVVGLASSSFLGVVLSTRGIKPVPQWRIKNDVWPGPLLNSPRKASWDEHSSLCRHFLGCQLEHNK